MSDKDKEAAAAAAKVGAERDRDPKEAAAAGKVEPRMSDKMGKCGPMEFPDGIKPTPAQLREAIEAAEQVDVVLSDGVDEIKADQATRDVTGDTWKDTPQGLKLMVDEWLVHGAGMGSQVGSLSIAGYALLVDGNQISWAPRPEPLVVNPGATVNLKDDVIF
jgi:hypothetical protein